MAIKHEAVVARGDLLTSTMWNAAHIIEDMTIKGIHIDSLQIGTDHLIDDAVTTAKLAILDYLDLVNRTTDPVLAKGRLWFREDLVKLRFSPDGTTVKEIAWAGDLSSHITATPIDHPDLSVVTAKIADAAITAAKLADANVTWLKTNVLPTITPTISLSNTTWTGTENINDKDFATYGSGTYSPPNAVRRDSVIATFDLGALSFVAGATKASAWHSATADYDTYIYLETSLDGTTWVTEASFTVPAATTAESICYLQFPPKIIRYIRVRISMALYAEYGYSRIYEVVCK